jgi:hypothetical protein
VDQPPNFATKVFRTKSQQKRYKKGALLSPDVGHRGRQRAGWSGVCCGAAALGEIAEVCSCSGVWTTFASAVLPFVLRATVSVAALQDSVFNWNPAEGCPFIACPC